MKILLMTLCLMLSGLTFAQSTAGSFIAKCTALEENDLVKTISLYSSYDPCEEQMKESYAGFAMINMDEDDLSTMIVSGSQYFENSEDYIMSFLLPLTIDGINYGHVSLGKLPTDFGDHEVTLQWEDRYEDGTMEKGEVKMKCHVPKQYICCGR